MSDSKPHSGYDLDQAMRLARWYDEHRIPRGSADEAVVNMARALIGSVEQLEASQGALKEALASLMEGQPDRPRPLHRAEQILRAALASNPAKRPT